MKFLIIPLCLLLTACNDRPTAPTSRPVPDYQEFLFEVSYVNYAWGRQINGVFIDHQGHVYSYDHSHEVPAAFDKINRGEGLTYEDLRDLYSNPERIDEVDPTTLNRMVRYVDTAAEGKLSEPSYLCADAGGLSYIAYRFDPETRLYHGVELLQAGDMAFRNESLSAAILYEWLVDATGRKPFGCLPE